VTLGKVSASAGRTLNRSFEPCLVCWPTSLLPCVGTSSDAGQGFCQRGQNSIAVLGLSDLLADIIASILLSGGKATADLNHVLQ